MRAPRTTFRGTDTFVLALRGAKRKQQAQANAVKREATRLLAEAVIVGNEFGNPTGTPVRTGALRDHWGLLVNGEGGPRAFIPDDVRDWTGLRALDEIFRALSRVKMGTPTRLFNSAPYSGVIERGRIGNRGSLQAPAGMVRIAVGNWHAICQRAVDTVRAGAAVPIREDEPE